MIALLIAAQLAVAPTVTTRIPPGAIYAPDARNPFAAPAWCRDRLQRTARDRTAVPRKLGELPPANLEYAVDRRVAGCPVPTPVRYNDGRPIRSR